MPTTDEFGNWYSCAEDGYYVEMITDGGKYQYVTRKAVSEWADFKVVGDTLIQSAIDDPTRKSKAIIQKSGDSMVLDYLTSDEYWRFQRIHGMEPRQPDAEKITQAKKRAEAAGCKEEPQDSSGKFIYFQF